MAFGGAAARSFARRPFGARRRGSASSWSPLDFGSDLLFWFDANVDCSGALWVDQGPNGYDLSQVTGSKQPTLITADADFDGNNSLEFSAAALQTMSTAAFAYGKFEIWIVCSTSAATRLYTQADYAKSIYMSGATQGYANNLTEGKLDLIGASTLEDPIPRARIIGHRWDGTHATHQVLENGVDITDSTVLDMGPSTTPETGVFWLASYLDSGEYLQGKFAEIFAIKNRASTAPETVSASAYLAGRYPSI